jgi:hypothetical protein
MTRKLTTLNAACVSLIEQRDEHDLPMLVLAFGEREDAAEGTLMIAGRAGDLSVTFDSAETLYPHLLGFQRTSRHLLLTIMHGDEDIKRLGVSQVVMIHFDERHEQTVSRAMAWFAGLTLDQERAQAFSAEQFDKSFPVPA